MKTLKVRTSYAGNKDITPGKIYIARVLGDPQEDIGFYLAVMIDSGSTIHTIEKGTAHLEYNNWEIVPEGPSLEDELAEAIAPFAALLQKHNSKGPDSQPIFGINDATFNLGDLRKAVAALAKYKESKQ